MSQHMYQFELLKVSDVSARGLILSLLSAIGARPQSVKDLVRAGALFDIESTAMRVAINRLQKDELLISISRGVYGPGPAAMTLMTHLKSWREAPSRKTAWNGDWLLALTAHLGRRNRKRVRSRERALRLNGYAPTDNGFWVRPANLNRRLNVHREDMISLGADAEMIFTHVVDFAPMNAEAWKNLWSERDLNAAYKEGILAIGESQKSLASKSAADAAVETLLVGQSVIKLINFDPLLPAEFCDVGLFKALIESMKEYNEVGIKAWRSFQLNGESEAVEAN